MATITFLKEAESPFQERILTSEALEFLMLLHREFNGRRKELLLLRKEKQAQLNSGVLPNFLDKTLPIRQDPSWSVAKTPHDLEKRYVEITGPVDRKMMINALNSGANIFMADFEDALSPTWKNIIEGQQNLIDAIQGTLSYHSPEGKNYILNDQTATLMIRPRGWHLEEKHLHIEGEPISGALFDFGLYIFHNGKKLLEKQTAPYFYLPKLENHLEARLWNDIFLFAQNTLSIPKGSIRATVLIETILAIFEAEEILFELREHSAGLNAGRWDYIFSIIKKFQQKPHFLLPDRSQVTMTVPFMEAYAKYLVHVCHKRKAYALGGMAAFIPNKSNPEITRIALEKVREDKQRECLIGFDGTWVAHPGLVPLAMQVFEEALKGKPNQLEKQVPFSLPDLLNFTIPAGQITEKGIRQNIKVSLQYLASWLKGVGAVALSNLMEDAATAEISRAQLWQWVHNSAKLADGREMTPSLLAQWFEEEYQNALNESNADTLELARKLIEPMVTDKKFEDFLTSIAYQHLN